MKVQKILIHKIKPSVKIKKILNNYLANLTRATDVVVGVVKDAPFHF